MHARGDYVWLYETLGTTPDAGLDELKHRYRQKVAELHPDRHPEYADDGFHSDELVALNIAFEEALEFHRRSGRLPGAAHRPAVNPPGPEPLPGLAAAMPNGAAAISSPWARPARPTSPARRGPWLAAALAAVGVIGLATGIVFEPSAPTLALSSGGSFSLPDAPAAPTYLERGLNRETVRKLEGDPFLDAGSRFEYGPSYVEFHGDKVVGWYSSPMQPLHVRPGQDKR